MKRLIWILVAWAGSALAADQPPPADVFVIKSVSGGHGGYKWYRDDIYARTAGNELDYVGTTDEGPPRGLGFLGEAIQGLREITKAQSADGRAIVFRHRPWHAPRAAKLGGGIYRYAYGSGLTLLHSDAELIGGTHSRWTKAPPPDVLPFVFMARVYSTDGKWSAVRASGDEFPLALTDASPLHWAAFEGRTSDCTLLAKNGADIGARTYWDATALELAIIYDREDTALELLTLGADPAPSGAYPALHRAIMSGRMRVIHALLDRGVDPNALDEAGRTPLHMAASVRTRVERDLESFGTPAALLAKNFTTPLIQLLFDRGADPSIRDREGRTPLDVLNPDAPAEARQLLIERVGGQPPDRDR